MATASPGPDERCSMGLLNINGLRSKMNEIEDIIEKHSLHVVALCETRLDASVKDSKVYIPGFRMWRKDRDILKEDDTQMRGGGVALYVQDHIETRLRSDLMETEAEIIWLEMKLPGRSVLVGSCYRRPTDDVALIEINQTMTLASKENEKQIFLMGDFNFNWDDELVIKPPKAISVLGLTQIVNVDTRKERCLDHIYTNVPDLCSDPKSTVIKKSDHNLITFMVRTDPQTIRRSNIEFDENQFKEDMKAAQWDDVKKETDPTRALSTLTEKFLSLANQQTQDVHPSPKSRPMKKQRQGNQKLLDEAKKDSRTLLKLLIEHFGKEFPSYVININKMGESTSEARRLDFICQPYTNATAEGSQVQNNTQVKGRQQFSFTKIDAETVRTLVEDLCDHAPHGMDENEAKRLKLAACDISDPICHILNNYLSNKEFQFRENINGDSVHILFSSIFDIILFQQAKKHMINNNLIPSASVEETVKEINDEWKKVISEGKRVQAVFLDFRSSFDIIRHDLLMEKLKVSGFSDSARSLIKTFLSTCKCSLGLPRRSFLARLLFTVFISDLRTVLEPSSFAICDSCIMIYCADKNTKILKKTLDNKVESVQQWAEGFGFRFTETRSKPLNTRNISRIYDILESLVNCHQDQLNWIRALEKIVPLFNVWYNYNVKDEIGEYFTESRLKTVPPKVLESVVNSLLLFQPDLRDL